MELDQKRKRNYKALQEKTQESDDIIDYTIDDAVETIGFGKFQMLIVCVAGMAWIVAGSETMVLAILGPILVCEWHLSTVSQALLTASSFLGMVSAAWLAGTFSDLYGRKKCLVVSSVAVLWSGLLCSFAPNFIWMLFLRFLVGSATAGTDMAVTYYIEFLPVKNRGKSVILINIFFALGGTLTVLLAMLFLNAFGWRVWVFLCALPAAGFLIFSALIPESPRFHLACGRVDLARQTIQKAAETNGCELPPGELRASEVSLRARPKDLVAPGYRLVFLLVMILWLTGTFIYFGIYFLTAQMVEIGDSCTPGSDSGIRWACGLECGQYEVRAFTDLLFTSLSELSGLFLPVFLLDTLGRKKTLLTMFSLVSLFCCPLMFCLKREQMVVFLFMARSAGVAIYQLLFVYTPEVYPTKVRSMSLGVGAFVGKIGAALSPTISQVLLQKSVAAAVGIYLGAGVIGSISSFLLPVETSGKSLDKQSSKSKTQKTNGDR